MPEETKKELETVNVEVHCDTEKRVVGHLKLAKGARPKVVHPNLAQQAFVPYEEKYQLPPKAPKPGGYWSCPHCAGRLCVTGEKHTGEAYPLGHPKAGQPAPPVKGALSPVVLGRTQVQAS